MLFSLEGGENINRSLCIDIILYLELTKEHSA
jgi:hypothetical protein